MDTPRSLPKPLRTALIAFICLTLLTTPVVGQSGTMIDDFEDGVFDDSWSTSGDITTTTNDTYAGTYSAVSVDGPVALTSLPDTTPSAISIAYQDNGEFEDVFRLTQSDSDAIECAAYSNNWGCYDYVQDTTVMTSVPAPNNEWFVVEFVNIDWSNQTFDLRALNETGHVLGRENDLTFAASVGSADEFGWESETGSKIDNLKTGTAVFPESTVSGTVTDEDNDAVPNALVEARNSTTGDLIDSDQTNSVGQYALDVEDGENDIRVSKQGYLNSTKQVTVTSDTTVDFQLTSLNSSIELDARNFLEHGESSPYTVVVDNGTGRADVTNSTNLTVTSNDTSIVTVDTINNELVATSDISVNNRTFITAEYQDPDGTTYTATQNVTVANVSVENLKILPTGPRLEAAMGANSDEDPTADTIPVIIVAMILGAGVTIFARSFAGLMAATLVITLGWIGGMVGNGMIIVTVVTALMIGLNVATNVDYSIRT